MERFGVDRSGDVEDLRLDGGRKEEQTDVVECGPDAETLQRRGRDRKRE